MNTPEEKAKKLVSHFRGLAKDGIRSNSNFHAAKECAIICVDEIIEAVCSFGYSGTWYNHEETGKMTLNDDESPIAYWEQVKQAINEL